MNSYASKACTSFKWKGRGIGGCKNLFQTVGIDVLQDAYSVTYAHFFFYCHQNLESEGAEIESMFTGPEALKTVDSASQV
jgi:hypothetical protein